MSFVGGAAEMNADEDARQAILLGRFREGVERPRDGDGIDAPLPIGNVKLQLANEMSSVPKNRLSTSAAAPPSTLCPESWSGIG